LVGLSIFDRRINDVDELRYTVTAAGKLTLLVGDTVLETVVIGKGAVANSINGNAGNDILAGGLGNDILTNGTVNDFFVFNKSHTNNVDIITDFTSGADK
jgi:Ca2+-binding RTX toxin-like protein